MCACVCVHVHVCMCACVCMCVCARMYVCMHVYVCMCVCLRMCVRMHVRACVCVCVCTVECEKKRNSKEAVQVVTHQRSCEQRRTSQPLSSWPLTPPCRGMRGPV